MNTADIVREQMKPMLERARAEGLWFHCFYQDMWFSPDQLEAEQENGNYLWGSLNWTLKDPKARLSQMDLEIKNMQTKRKEFENSI